MRVYGLGFMVEGLGFRVEVLGVLGFWGLGPLKPGSGDSTDLSEPPCSSLCSSPTIEPLLDCLMTCTYKP